jgi:hypothetical protein
VSIIKIFSHNLMLIYVFIGTPGVPTAVKICINFCSVTIILWSKKLDLIIPLALILGSLIKIGVLTHSLYQFMFSSTEISFTFSIL